MTGAWRVVGGKGGVGKTTLAAALAIEAAEKGGEVLVASVDPAHSLGDALGVRLSSSPRRIPTRRGRLRAVEIDAGTALEAWLVDRRSRLARITAAGTYLDEGEAGELLGLSFPGFEEVFALQEVERLSRPGEAVVVDTAPTGHALRLLETPAALERIADLLDRLLDKERWIRSSLGGRAQVPGEEIADELRETAATTGELLRSARITWVLLPEPVVVAETVGALASLKAAGLAPAELVVNRRRARPPQRCRTCDGRRAEEERALQPLRRVKLLAVPEFPKEPRGPAALRRVARALAPLARGKIARRSPAPPSEPGPGAFQPAASLRLLLFGGKGGVGKTTCAAATALRLARERPQDRVFLLSIDPAHSVSDVLGLAAARGERRVAGRMRNLSVLEVDAAALLGEKREAWQRSVDGVFDRLRGGSRLDATFDRAIARDLVDVAPPGLDEVLGMVAMLDALFPAEGPAASVVVVDSAPTGHMLRLLAMPEAAAGWVRVLLRLLMELRPAAGLPTAAQDLVGVSRQLRSLKELLRDPARAGLVAVTRAARLPLLETRRLLDGTRRLGLAPVALIINGRTPPGCTICKKAAALEAAELRRFGSAGGCAILAAPRTTPAPRGVVSLLSWSGRWSVP